jgi:hypothetical protein
MILGESLGERQSEILLECLLGEFLSGRSKLLWLGVLKLWFILSFLVSIIVELLISPLPFNKILFCYFDLTGSIRNLWKMSNISNQQNKSLGTTVGGVAMWLVGRGFASWNQFLSNAMQGCLQQIHYWSNPHIPLSVIINICTKQNCEWTNHT